MTSSPDTSGGGGGSPSAGERIATDANQPRGPQAAAAAQENIAGIGTGKPAGPGDNPPTTGQLPGTAGKVVGAGLEAGSTDFGPSTAPTTGGRTGAGASDAGRSVTAGPGSAGGDVEGVFSGGGGGGPGIGAGGNTVTATGRPLRGDAREVIGRAAVGGSGVPQDPGVLEPGQTTRGATGPSGAVSRAPGAAGRGTADTLDRPADAVEGKAALVEGTLPGGGERGLASAAEATPRTPADISEGTRRPDANRGKGS